MSILVHIFTSSNNKVMEIQELKSTGVYNIKAIEKYFAKQVKAAMIYGANEVQAIEQAAAMLRIYGHNFLIRVAA
jgi:hypothetical protein